MIEELSREFLCIAFSPQHVLITVNGRQSSPSQEMLKVKKYDESEYHREWSVQIYGIKFFNG